MSPTPYVSAVLALLGIATLVLALSAVLGRTSPPETEPTTSRTTRTPALVEAAVLTPSSAAGSSTTAGIPRTGNPFAPLRSGLRRQVRLPFPPPPPLVTIALPPGPVVETVP